MGFDFEPFLFTAAVAADRAASRRDGRGGEEMTAQSLPSPQEHRAYSHLRPACRSEAERSAGRDSGKGYWKEILQAGIDKIPEK